MKYKRDYEITISADNCDNSFWQARHKGELKSNWDFEDYETILSMLDAIRYRISSRVASLRMEDLPETKILREIQVDISNFDDIAELAKEDSIHSYRFASSEGMSVVMSDGLTVAEQFDWLVQDTEHRWWCMKSDYHKQLVNLGKLVLVK